MKKNTYFCDIDGTIFKYRKFEEMTTTKPQIIESIVKQLQIWYNEGHHIVLTTARPEEYRHHTLMELFDNDVKYHQLVMGIERGPRYLLNDMDPEIEGKRAIAVNLTRDKGFD